MISFPSSLLRSRGVGQNSLGPERAVASSRCSNRTLETFGEFGLRCIAWLEDQADDLL